ncbi:HAMP domain-containing protein [candidate division KSB1 bacterium]|nr:HAMP domain-containing protein [candidate division KSB1 bacterium]RQW09793.1 MAG: sensor histidine kinase [candidate division KSB1 bacterium]
MPIIVKWSLFILLLAFAFSILLWFRTRRVSRFQARLTLFFFLFVIIPLAPLALFIGQMVIKSSETLLIPGVEESFTLSLDVFRDQLEARGRHFLRLHPHLAELDPDRLREQEVSYVGEFAQQDSLFLLQRFLAATAELALQHNRLQKISAMQMDQLLEYGTIVAEPGADLFEAYERIDSNVVVVGFAIPDQMVIAKDRVTTALRSVRTLGLLRDKMVEENVVWFLIIIFILVVAIVSALLARVVSSGLSGPIRKLTEGMQKIGAGDLSYRVEAKAKDELAYLIESFNRMVAELKMSQESLGRAERAAAWRDVARQISHEIKNPLTPIEFSIYRLESSLPSTAEVSESLRIIKEEIAAIRRIADTFSRFAKMPHAELKMQRLSDVVKSSVDLFQNDASGVRMQFHAAPDLPDVPLDEQQIRSVMHNLLKNAIEASAAGSNVQVRVGPDERGARGIKIEVTDSGCGMDEETRKRIFDPYFTTKQGGSGIGLFLAQRIIADHGGRILVASAPGAGTTFTIIF